jgi:hypothetical protein
LPRTSDHERASIEIDHEEETEDSYVMKPESPFSPAKAETENELKAPSSRFIDEKISDESDTESLADSALKPTGLDNPFWN